MTQVIDSSVSQQWLNTLLLGIFASASLLLTGIGVYGVLSYSVGQRMREFGIRMALGAQRGGLMIFVLRQAALLTLTGAAIGVVGAWMLMRMMTTLLFGVSAVGSHHVRFIHSDHRCCFITRRPYSGEPRGKCRSHEDSSMMHSVPTFPHVSTALKILVENQK